MMTSERFHRPFNKFRIVAPRVPLRNLMLPALVRIDAPSDEDPFEKINKVVVEAKKQFDNFKPKDFDALMRSIDLFRSLRDKVSKKYKMLIATNASLKMYELIVQMQLIHDTNVRAFCNAELPGAFIVAINHYMKTVCPHLEFDWVASSYDPKDAAALGNNTIICDQYGIYAGNRDRWLMGPPPNAMPKNAPSITGDVTDPAVVEALANAVRARYGTGATLYTSDAGIDASSDYNRQEEITARINYGQIICGILSLAKGGHLVTKQYTFLTLFSRSLIALLAALFDELYVVKPLTSRPVNSEVYIIGKYFRGFDENPDLPRALLDRLAEYKTKDPCDWSPLIDPVFMRYSSFV